MISQFAEHLRAATFKHASRDHFSCKLSLSQLTSFARNLICLGVSNFRKMKRSYRWLELIQLLIIFLCCFICNNINYLKLQVTTEKSSTKVDIITLFTYFIYKLLDLWKGKSYIRDSGHFLEKIKTIITLPENAILVTADVAGLYPSISHQSGLSVI